MDHFHRETGTQFENKPEQMGTMSKIASQLTGSGGGGMNQTALKKL